MAYIDKLKDPRWQKKRLKILERDNFTCRFCDATESTLHVHHIAYEYEDDPWEVDDHLLLTLCEDCHRTEEQDLKEWSKALLNQLRSVGFTSRHMFLLTTMVFSDANYWSIENIKVIGFAINNEDVWGKLIAEFEKHEIAIKNEPNPF